MVRCRPRSTADDLSRFWKFIWAPHRHPIRVSANYIDTSRRQFQTIFLYYKYIPLILAASDSTSDISEESRAILQVASIVALFLIGYTPEIGIIYLIWGDRTSHSHCTVETSVPWIRKIKKNRGSLILRPCPFLRFENFWMSESCFLQLYLQVLALFTL